jgi:hypothetical protein
MECRRRTGGVEVGFLLGRAEESRDFTVDEVVLVIPIEGVFVLGAATHEGSDSDEIGV